MKRLFSLGPMLAVRVPPDVVEHARLALGDKLTARVVSGKIVYEKAGVGRRVTFRAKDFGLPIMPIPCECERALGLEVGQMVDLVVRGGLVVLVPAA